MKLKTKTQIVNQIKKLIREYQEKRNNLSQHANHRGKYNMFITDLMSLLVE